MPRRMSVALTLDAVRRREKTETRRRAESWRDLKAGDRLTLIEKGMGLPKGARQVVVTDVEVVEVVTEPLARITDADVVAEGFPSWTRTDFIRFWLGSHGYPETADPEDVDARVIRWRYLDDEPAT